MARNYIPTKDVALVTLDGYQIETSDEYSCEAEISEGEKQELIINGELIASEEAPTILKGYNLTFKDNAIRPQVMQKLQGGTYTPETESKGFNYKGPAVGALKPVRMNEVCVYTKVYAENGFTGEYIKVAYTDCIGDLVNFGFKGGEFFSSEFTIKSRPSSGVDSYDMELVTQLPTPTV